MRITKLLLALGVVASTFQACDYVDDPTPPNANNGNGGGDTSEAVVRKVLLEDITGHRCNNCPRAARIAQDLQDDLFGENLILVGVHAGSFAAPYAPIGDGIYDSDHRTPAGTTYQQAFQVFFFPAGLISRRPFDNSVVVSEGSWGAAVAEIAGEPSAFDLEITDITVQGDALSAQVRLSFVEDVQGDHNLVVYLVEDHVVDWQLDAEASPPDVPDYDHRHMLRANLNGTWGEPVVTGSAAAGDTVTVDIPAYSLDPAWNTANFYLVAWVYDTGSEEVMQAEERKFQP
ncbi:MAG: Omp28-related outer membrane protein [Flavobacteriales bacterium]|nr:Omp28-related outer membrane protein [Flavobacteriales bacterium]